MRPKKIEELIKELNPLIHQGRQVRSRVDVTKRAFGKIEKAKQRFASRPQSADDETGRRNRAAETVRMLVETPSKFHQLFKSISGRSSQSGQSATKAEENDRAYKRAKQELTRAKASLDRKEKELEEIRADVQGKETSLSQLRHEKSELQQPEPRALGIVDSLKSWDSDKSLIFDPAESVVHYPDHGLALVGFFRDPSGILAVSLDTRELRSVDGCRIVRHVHKMDYPLKGVRHRSLLIPLNELFGQ
ncbi:hypothetical protein NM208_g7053 [Fusarium decemcellulare]|uniref:Uncharacterized protein n=1 Tax=Fusarium decemcellulare TaxID=57161 RepID=A0ACC1SAZ1_9HYPO|nr:hypothetical protein NM208_g7053 [Fusarium decemcellulare]